MITTLTADRHVQIKALLRKEYPEILDQFNRWNFRNSVIKALSQIAERETASM